MNRPIALASLALGLGVALPAAAVAQTAKDLVGTWTNFSNINIRADGSRVSVFGPNGKGLAIFDSNGHFAIVNINPDVPKFAANNRAQGTPAENKAAMEGGSPFSAPIRLVRTRSSTSRSRAARIRTGPGRSRSELCSHLRETS
jgi:hypothetical protein